MTRQLSHQLSTITMIIIKHQRNVYFVDHQFWMMLETNAYFNGQGTIRLSSFENDGSIDCFMDILLWWFTLHFGKGYFELLDVLLCEDGINRHCYKECAIFYCVLMQSYWLFEWSFLRITFVQLLLSIMWSEYVFIGFKKGFLSPKANSKDDKVALLQKRKEIKISFIS